MKKERKCAICGDDMYGRWSWQKYKTKEYGLEEVCMSCGRARFSLPGDRGRLAPVVEGTVVNRDELIRVIQQWYGQHPDVSLRSDTLYLLTCITQLADAILALPYTPPPEVRAKLREAKHDYQIGQEDKGQRAQWLGFKHCLLILGLHDAVTKPQEVERK